MSWDTFSEVFVTVKIPNDFQPCATHLSLYETQPGIQNVTYQNQAYANLLLCDANHHLRAIGTPYSDTGYQQLKKPNKKPHQNQQKANTFPCFFIPICSPLFQCSSHSACMSNHFLFLNYTLLHLRIKYLKIFLSIWFCNNIYQTISFSPQ